MKNPHDPLSWDGLRSAPSEPAAAVGASANASFGDFASGPHGPGYPALYYDGKSAKGRQVRFEAQPAGFLRIYDLEDRAVYVDWPGAEIAPSGSVHDFPLQLRRMADTGERLCIEDPAGRHFMETWLEPRLKQQSSRRIRKWLLVVGIAWACIALVWLNMNAVMNVAVSLIPESWEHELGRESKEQIARLLTLTPVGEIPWCAGERGTAALTRLAARLDMPMTADPGAAGEAAGENAGTPAGEDVRPVEIAVLDSKIINAFALPGRHIVVTSAMLAEAAAPEELAGVLAHEMGHVTERHSTKRVVRAYGLELIFQLVAGQGDLFNAVGGLGYTLVQNKFSRADEALADRLGVERMLAAGLDPAPLADLFARIQAKDDEAGGGAGYLDWEYLSDHPSFDSRIAEIRGLAEADAAEKSASGKAAAYTPALSAADWADLQNICAEPVAE